MQFKYFNLRFNPRRNYLIISVFRTGVCVVISAIVLTAHQLSVLRAAAGIRTSSSLVKHYRERKKKKQQTNTRLDALRQLKCVLG